VKTELYDSKIEAPTPDGPVFLIERAMTFKARFTLWFAFFVLLATTAQAQSEATREGYLRCRNRANGWMYETTEEKSRLSTQELNSRISELDTCYGNYLTHKELPLPPDPHIVVPMETRLNFYATESDLTNMLIVETGYLTLETLRLSREVNDEMKEKLLVLEFIQQHQLLKAFERYKANLEKSKSK
jgi:hypothetical protein